MKNLSNKKSFRFLGTVGLLSVALLSAACSSREERAQNYYTQGKSYLDKHDYVKARLEFKNALQLNDNMTQAWRALAEVDEHDKNFQALVADLRRVVELDAKDADARVRLGKMLLLGRDVRGALKLANEATEIEPKNASVLAFKAAVLFRLKDIDGATKTAQSVIDIDPANVDAYVILASAKFLQGDSDGALQILAKVPDAHKDDLPVLMTKVNILNRAGDVQQAESILKRLVTLHEGDAFFRTQLIRFYLAHNKQDDALNELHTAARTAPTDNNIEFEYINLLSRLQGPAAARAEIVERIASGKGNIFPFKIALANLDFAQGNFDKSKALLEELIKSSSSSAEVIAARNELTKMYMARNDIADAEPLVTETLKADGRNTAALRFRAAIHMARNQYDDAIADLRSALNDDPQSPELLATLALAYERSGSIELADKAFLDATKASKYSPTYGLNYVEFLRRRGLNEQADNVLADLANRNPKSIPVLSALAQIKLAHHDWADAHQIANMIRSLDKKSTVADLINGAAFSGQNKVEDSVTVLENAYDANPQAIQPMAELVGVYMRAHQPDKAEAFLQSALKANPNNVDAIVLLGTIQLAKNNPSGAAKYYNDAIKAQPKAAAGYRALADLYTREGKTDDALKTIQTGLQQQPNNFELRLNLAMLMDAKGNYDQAINEYESMLKDQPGSMIAANNLASLLADHRTDQASLDKAKTLATLLKNSQVPQFNDTVGWVDFRRGDYSAALPLLQQAAAKLPNLPVVHYHLGMSYLAAGQRQEAEAQFSKVRELAPKDADLSQKIDEALKSSSTQQETKKPQSN